MAAVSGGITAFVIRLTTQKKYDVVAIANGILAGLVSITAPCATVYPYVAVVIGFIGAFVYCGASALVKKCKVDDPLDAFAVHGACGTWGVLAAGLFDFNEGVFMREMEGQATRQAGKVFGIQVAAIICIAAWSAVLSSIIFGTLKYLGLLRVTLEEEKLGCDGGEQAYVFVSNPPHGMPKADSVALPIPSQVGAETNLPGEPSQDDV
eukprot:NODE_20196_length_808_cov_4.058737.p1 GENE.NODE_20196_length_808_cov_4.058737~~NODE_20196_length_808_cov_4.058737.p1  ORF type:complete len:229 (+),score=58.01 NODE_20196_length_808_cov_4.058737:66-689(+)